MSVASLNFLPTDKDTQARDQYIHEIGTFAIALAIVTIVCFIITSFYALGRKKKILRSFINRGNTTQRSVS